MLAPGNYLVEETIRLHHKTGIMGYIDRIPGKMKQVRLSVGGLAEGKNAIEIHDVSNCYLGRMIIEGAGQQNVNLVSNKDGDATRYDRLMLKGVSGHGIYLETSQNNEAYYLTIRGCGSHANGTYPMVIKQPTSKGSGLGGRQIEIFAKPHRGQSLEDVPVAFLHEGRDNRIIGGVYGRKGWTRYGINDRGQRTKIIGSLASSMKNPLNRINGKEDTEVVAPQHFSVRRVGRARLPAGSTSLRVEHGLDGTPPAKRITVTPLSGWVASRAAKFEVDKSSVDATGFDIVVDTVPGREVEFGWTASLAMAEGTG